MALKKEPFVKYEENSSSDSFTIRLNSKEREVLEKCKLFLQQDKDSTAIKQLALGVGANVIHDEKIKGILSLVLNNYRKNKRLGIVNFE